MKNIDYIFAVGLFICSIILPEFIFKQRSLNTPVKIFLLLVGFVFIFALMFLSVGVDKHFLTLIVAFTTSAVILTLYLPRNFIYALSAFLLTFTFLAYISGLVIYASGLAIWFFVTFCIAVLRELIYENIFIKN